MSNESLYKRKSKFYPVTLNPYLRSSVPAPVNACRVKIYFETSLDEFKKSCLFNWGGLAAAKLVRAKMGGQFRSLIVAFDRSAIYDGFIRAYNFMINSPIFFLSIIIQLLKSYLFASIRSGTKIGA
jgi:hypothetical protein